MFVVDNGDELGPLDVGFIVFECKVAPLAWLKLGNQDTVGFDCRWRVTQRRQDPVVEVVLVEVAFKTAEAV